MAINIDLSAHNLYERIELHNWVSGMVSQDSSKADIYSFLNEQGIYFSWSYPPELHGIPLPYKTIPFGCHTNSTHYLCTIQNEKPELLEDLYFVSGVYGLKANNSCVPRDKRYFIDHHSFILHKGVVIDWTVLNHPPKYYDVDQYFGVAFPAMTVLEVMDELVLENRKGPMVPLMVLKNKPCVSKISYLGS